MKLASLAEPTLAGRSKELDELHLSLKLMTQGKGSTVFVAGEAGSGKTRLATEFLNIAKKQNVIVLSGWCISNSAIPYFPFIEALASYAESDERNLNSDSQLTSIKNRLSGSRALAEMTLGSLTPQTWKDQTYSLITREFLKISTKSPLILFIDDLHWADSASLSLLHYLARTILSNRILILATYRSEEVETFLDGQVSNLKDALRLMARDNLFKEIKLANLSHNNIQEIVESMLNGRAHPSLIDKLTNDSQGLPLFVVESTRALFEQQKIKKEEKFWTLAIQDSSVPDKVKDIIHRRIDQLRPSQKRILEVAAVIGEKFDPVLVSTVVGQSTIDVLESLNAIEKTTLLVHYEGSCYLFGHAKYREMLYQDIPELIKKEYHHNIAQKMEESTRYSELPVNDLAYHYAKSGNKNKSAQYELMAGQLALNKFSNNEALQHFKHALALSDDEPIIKVAATEGLGEAYFANGIFEESLKIFENLGDSTDGTSKLKSYRRAMDSAFFKGEFAKLLALTKKAQEYSAFNRLENARILMNRARAVLFLGNPKAGSLDFEAALKVFEDENSIPDIARVLLGLGGRGPRRFGIERGLANELRAVLYFQELGDLRGLADAYNRAGQSFAYRLLYDEALSANQQCIHIAERVGHFSRVAEAYASISLVYESTLRTNEALVANLKALEFAIKSGSQWTLAITYSNFVVLYSMLENLGQAEYYYSLLSAMPPEILSNTFVRIGACRVALALAKKQYSQAIELLQENLSGLKDRASPSQEVAIYKEFALALEKQGRNTEALFYSSKAQKLALKVKQAFEHSKICAFFLTTKKVALGEEFRVRLDLFNVSTKEARIVSVQGITPKGLKIVKMSGLCRLENGSVIVCQKTLEPFYGASVIVDFQAEKSGVFMFSPKLCYLNDLQKTKNVNLAPYVLNVSTFSLDSSGNAPITIEMSSKASKSTFDYLIRSFVEDSTRQKLPLEIAGWRTLMDIAKNTLASKYSLYEFSRNKPVIELERLGLVESKHFIGERGRGGRVLKIRAAYDNQSVRAILSSANRTLE